MNLEPQIVRSFGSMRSTFIVGFNPTYKHVINTLQFVGVDSKGIQIKLNEHEINKKLGHLIQLTFELVDLSLWLGNPWVLSSNMMFVTYVNPNYIP
jgi:hypothetical protein